MAMPTNNKSCNEVHTNFNSASHRVLVPLRTARTLQMAWVAVMVMSLSVEARSGGPSRPRIISIKANQPRTVKITGRNLMGSRPITATIRLHRRATPTSKVTAVSFLRKGLNQPIGSRWWPRRLSNSRNSKAYSTSSRVICIHSIRHPLNILGRATSRAATTPILSQLRSIDMWCSSSTDTQLIYPNISKMPEIPHTRPSRAMKPLTQPRWAVPANRIQPRRPKLSLIYHQWWISSSYKTIRAWCPSVISSRTPNLWKCRISWAWRRRCQLLGPGKSILHLQSSIQQSKTHKSTRARYLQSHSNLVRTSMSKIWWQRCRLIT